VTQRLFAGAKLVTASCRTTRKEIRDPNAFDYAVDWGWFWFFTQPIFLLLDLFYGYIGNFGVAILLLTVVIKLLFFPLADASYRSMSRMKKLQPQVERSRRASPTTSVRQQQEMMELYKREKVNPVSGCLPMLIQIPVFFSLYKVLTSPSRCARRRSSAGFTISPRPIPPRSSICSGCCPIDSHAFVPAFWPSHPSASGRS
jgi:YidC/Oxa1 family membrane protein insertase